MVGSLFGPPSIYSQRSKTARPFSTNRLPTALALNLSHGERLMALETRDSKGESVTNPIADRLTFVQHAT